MKKGRFLWSAHRITERQKAGKARNIKGKQLKNSRSTASRLPAALRSSASANLPFKWSNSPSLVFPAKGFLFAPSQYSKASQRSSGQAQPIFSLAFPPGIPFIQSLLHTLYGPFFALRKAGGCAIISHNGYLFWKVISLA